MKHDRSGRCKSDRHHRIRTVTSDGVSTRTKGFTDRQTASSSSHGPLPTGFSNHLDNKQIQQPPPRPPWKENSNLLNIMSYRDVVASDQHSTMKSTSECTESELIARLKTTVVYHQKLHVEAEGQLKKINEKYDTLCMKAKKKVEELKQQIEEINGKACNAHRFYEHNLVDLQQKNHSLEARINQLEHENLKLQRVHIKSINVVSPGVEPISDQAFVSRLIDIHDRVSEFCRAEFKKKKLVEVDEQHLTNLGLLERISEGMKGLGVHKISVGNFMDMAFWSTMEKVCEARWLPGLDSNEQSNTLFEMEKNMDESGKSSYLFLGNIFVLITR